MLNQVMIANLLPLFSTPKHIHPFNLLIFGLIDLFLLFLYKVYHSSKVFISNNDNDLDTPDATMTLSLTASDSGAESVWSRKASSQEDALNPADLDEVSDDALQSRRTPSVAKLIRQFSRCDTNDSLYRSPTCTSTDSIYNDCNGKGIVPRTRSSNNNDHSQQVPFVLTTWHRRNRSRRYSFSSLPSTDSSTSTSCSCCRDTNHCSCGCSNACSPIGSYFTT